MVQVNASEQRQASDDEFGAGNGSVTPGSLVVAPLASNDGSTPAPGTADAKGFPGLGQRVTDDQARAIVDHYIPPSERAGFDFDGVKDGAGAWYQCTAWAKARWRQMGYVGPNWSGNGGDVAGNINSMFGVQGSGEPSVGAIVSKPGHVAVVEDLRTLENGTVEFRVSEMNAGDRNYDRAASWEFQESRWWTYKPGRSNPYTFASFRTS